MPLPNPRQGESRSDFVSRCMASEVMKREYPNQDQRSAVCYSQWRRSTQSNSAIGQYSNLVDNYTMRQENLEGRLHYVVPVVMMVEGVHSGSAGPLYHTVEELSRFPEAWNGIPVVVHHPEQNGQYVSANSPEVIEDWQHVGRVFNTSFEEGKLKAEAWLDAEKISQFPEVLAYLQANRPLDVSVGVFTDDEPVSGTWNGEQYTAIARNYRPDHLALLPGGQGACSWADGCGVRANQKKGGEKVTIDSKKIKEFASKGFVIHAIGFQQISSSLQRALDAMDTNQRIHYLEEVFDDGTFIYKVVLSSNTGPNAVYYRRKYTITDNDEVEIAAEEPQEVKKKTEYVSVNSTQEGGQKNMSKKKKETKVEPCCQEKVEMLIQTNAFEEADREWLSDLDEGRIDKLLAMTEEKKPKEKKEEKVVTQEDALEVLKEQLSTEQFLDLLPSEIREQFDHGLKLHKAEKDKMVERIMACSEAFTKDELLAKPIAELEKIASLAKPKVDYSPLSANTNESTLTEDDVLLPLGVNIED